MKKSFIITIALFLALATVQARPGQDGKSGNGETVKEMKSGRIPLHKLEGNNVSEMAKNNFNTDFPNVSDLHWKRNGTFDEASFIKAGKQMTAFYDYEGNLVGSTRAAKLSELPEAAQNEIKTRYKGYKIGPVIFFKDNESNATDMILYGVQFDDADTWLVELRKGAEGIVVQVLKDGEVSYFTRL